LEKNGNCIILESSQHNCMRKYIPRLIEATIADQMRAAGCVVIEGPKWCGKSTTAERFAKTLVKLRNPIVFKKYETLAPRTE
jgi:predicted AAA+ superfamily ATPase